MTETDLRKLSADELAVYHEQGYVIVPDVFPLEKLAEIDREIDRIQETQKEMGRNSGWVMQLGLRSDVTRQFAQDERVLALIEDIVKPGISIYSAKLTAKVPHSNDICHWHQDNAYYNTHTLSETRMSTWIPLQDADETNGCLWVVPHSHKGGVVTHGPFGGQCPKCMGPSRSHVRRCDPMSCESRRYTVVPRLFVASFQRQPDRPRAAGVYCLISRSLRAARQWRSV